MQLCHFIGFIKFLHFSSFSSPWPDSIILQCRTLMFLYIYVDVFYIQEDFLSCHVLCLYSCLARCSKWRCPLSVWCSNHGVTSL